MAQSAMNCQPTTLLQHFASLGTKPTDKRALLTGIVCTVGPATTSKQMVKDLLNAGMSIARMNFSHGSHPEHSDRLKLLREAVEELENETQIAYPLAIALDTKGPEIRTGTIDEAIKRKVELKQDSEVILTVDPQFQAKCNDKRIYITYRDLPKVVKVGEEGTTIYISDGKIALQCVKVEGSSVKCKVLHGGLLGSKKGVAIPGVDLNLPIVSQQDSLDLKFGVDRGMDMILASFVQTAKDVQEIRYALGETGRKILIVSKIETQKALDNVDEIVVASDGVMVARGDLGVHLPPAQVFRAQKTIIAKCNLAGKPVICATQMLESMMDGIRPSRSDVSDIGNAVLDGADCVMLSGETSIGRHPVKCVQTMASVCRVAEISLWDSRVLQELVANVRGSDNNTAIAVASVQASHLTEASAIILYSTSVHLAREVARYKPKCPIFVATSDRAFARRMNLYRAIYSVVLPQDTTSADELSTVVAYVRRRGLLQKGDAVVTLTGTNATLGILCI